MNDRIKELAELALKSSMINDAVYRPEGYTNCVSKNFADKFAELILLECTQLFNNDSESKTRYSGIGAIGMINNYFGVD